MYILACKHSDEIIFYFDAAGGKYIASGGNLAWRLNNPGLVLSHGRYSRKNGAIGSCGRYAIFATPLEGRKALSAWLHSKKYYNSTLKTIAKHYQPNNPEAFANQLSSLTQISSEIKIKSLSVEGFDRLLRGIEKLCGYTVADNQTFLRLPKIIAKIENGKDKEDTYVIEDNTVLSKEETIKHITSHLLDAVIVHMSNGTLHIRSRPHHCIENIKINEDLLLPSSGHIDTLVRTVGEAKDGQYIWGFINGIGNYKEDALASTDLISGAAHGEQVYSMPNDTILWGLDGLAISCVLKITIDTPIVAWAVKFFRFLLSIAKERASKVIIFVHSQGAIISEHALELLEPHERAQLTIFTFGGGSFLGLGKAHPDTHNYASAADFVCSMGSPGDQCLALQKYYGHKEGLTDEQVIDRLARQDAMLILDTIDSKTIEIYVKERSKHYESKFSRISNVTVLDPDPDSKWKHRFNSECYQNTIKTIIKRYQEELENR